MIVFLCSRRFLSSNPLNMKENVCSLVGLFQAQTNWYKIKKKRNICSTLFFKFKHEVEKQLKISFNQTCAYLNVTNTCQLLFQFICMESSFFFLIPIQTYILLHRVYLIVKIATKLSSFTTWHWHELDTYHDCRVE